MEREMKKKIPKTLILLMVFLLPIKGFCQKIAHEIVAINGQSISTKLEDRTPKGIVKYFDRLIKDSLILVGQHCEGEQDYALFFESLYAQTGKYPGLLGLEYGWRANVDYNKVNKLLINHWQKGGIVTLTWCADNPFKDGKYNVSWNSMVHKDSIDLKKLLASAPDSEEKNNYRNELMNVVKGLKSLKESGVTVLWRPFHEMNGNWFWWGPNDEKAPTNLQDFQLLWQDMHKTFDEMGLNNLVWVFATNNPWNEDVRKAIYEMYPGSNYVDIVGMDIYKAPVPDFTDNYETLKRFNKTIVIAECGDDIDNKGTKVLNELEIIEKYRGKAGYFMQWASWHNPKFNVKVRRAIIDNPNAKEMMNHPSAVTLDEVK
jgi:mannan endo-1,4-beta-mannosidase